MADPDPSERNPAWYKRRWDDLMDLVPDSDPEAFLDRMRELQTDLLEEDSADLLDTIESLTAQAEAFEEQKDAFREAGFDRPLLALKAIESMEEQLQELYGEKEATEQPAPGTNLQREGDTFDQLQALMAREEKLQRELGVSDPDAVIEMVEGLSEQLEDLYRDREAEPSTDSIFASTASSSSSEAEQMLKDAFGVSDPEALTTMMYDLTDQLEELYAERERLAEFDLNGTDDALEMMKSMQQQLETLYERQEEMSDRGIDGMDNALSLIESMESQLNELYDERRQSAEQAGPANLEEATHRLQELEGKLSDLSEEKERLRTKRNRLQAQFEALENEFGTGDPDAISELIHSLEAQLQEFYEEREQASSAPSPSADDPLLPADTLARLDELDADDLDALPVGVFRLDDQGIVRETNVKALRWPDVEVDSTDALTGAHFFRDVAPGTDNDLFRGRVQEGISRGEMDEQFLYTYVSARATATNLVVHLHRNPDQSATWIAFRALEQYA